MADDVVNEQDVKTDVSTDSSSAESQNKVANPPTGENPGANESENRIPHKRFNEVIQERNEARNRQEALEARIRDMESRLSTAPVKVDDGSAEVERLVKNLGMDEKAARELMEVTRIANERANAPLRAQQQAAMLDNWNRDMAKRHTDYDDIVPDMEKVFSRLPAHMQNLVVSDPSGLEMLYNQAKASKSQDKTKEAFDKGSAEAYSKKGEKLAVSNLPGSGSKGTNQEISAEWIRNSSVADYKKNLNRINHWLATGKQS